MKNKILTFLILCTLLGLGGNCFAQYGLLQNDGLYVPRLTTAQRNAIATPTAGQMIYNTTYNCFDVYQNNSWQKLCGLEVAVSDKWTQKASFNASGRNNAVGFSIGNKGYIGTGDANSSYAKDFWEYDPTLNTWTQKANFGGVGRFRAIGFSIGTLGYVGTGNNGAGNSTAVLKDFWEYNPSTNLWTQKANFGGTGLTDGIERYGAIGFSIGNKGYVGTGLNQLNQVQKDIWEYNPSTNIWIQKNDFGGLSRVNAVSFTIGNKGYIGTGLGVGNYFKDFWEYTPTNDQWTQKAAFGGSERTKSCGFSIGTRGYIGSGESFGNFPIDFWEYDSMTDKWTKKIDFAGVGRDRLVGFSIGNKGYAGTGYSFPNNLNDLWEYDPIFTNITQQGNTFNGANQLVQLDATGSVTNSFINENFNLVTVFQNGWVNYGTPFSAAGYYKDDASRVNLKGLLKNGTTTIGTTLLTLPTGYRPSEQLIFMVVNGNDIGRIDVLPSGEVQTHTGGNIYVSLDNISFRANGN